MRIRTIAAAIAVVVVAAVIVVITRHMVTDPPGHDHAGGDSHAHIDPLDPTGATPDTVAINALTIAYTWRPGTDASTWEALHRAAALLTDPLARAAAARPDPAPKALQEWSSWVDSRDQVSAAAAPLAPATVDGDTASVLVRVTQTVLHAGGASTPYSSQVMQVELKQLGETWLMARYNVRGDLR
ncbi:hypothetical protein [Nocardia sp. XZ_19_231]|uniref:hypothetical protein n=1 Tax=Nocardia sp. XZ_19_231 TaxID=2769252 RepID=UPI00188FA2D6|nr:hypothetical protein [Nocardia sp. XZ_19_231]